MKDTCEKQKRAVEKKRQEFAEMYKAFDWPEKHVPLAALDVGKLQIHPLVQRFIWKLQDQLVDAPYKTFGKTEGSWEGYTLLFRGYAQNNDMRKPVADVFQEYLEKVYCPLMWTFLFGTQGWRELRPHYSQFKACTIKVCEGTSFYGDNVFHHHIDGKIGMLEKKNFVQRHMNRQLFSIVKDAVSDEALERRREENPEKSEEELVHANIEKCNDDPLAYGTTCYPIWQPKKGFRSNHEFHKYMQAHYNEVGLLNSGLPRPHYEVPLRRQTKGSKIQGKIGITVAGLGGQSEHQFVPGPCGEGWEGPEPRSSGFNSTFKGCLDPLTSGIVR